jgi:hypothetical protein
MDFPAPHAGDSGRPWSTANTWYPSLNVAKGRRLCENSARDSVWPRRERIFAIFLALRGDRPRNLAVALATSEFSHSLGGEPAYRGCAGNGRNRPQTGHSALRGIASSRPSETIAIRLATDCDPCCPLRSGLMNAGSVRKRSSAEDVGAPKREVAALQPAARGREPRGR